MLTAIRRWFERLFKPPVDDPRARPARWPSAEEIVLLPAFHALGFRDIVEVAAPADARRAYEHLATAGVVGFDTESKPTFRKGEVSNGPHVAQFATTGRAYVFMLHDPECRKTAATLIALGALKKVGFGLGDDLRRIREKLRVEPREVLDLETLFAEKGFGRGVGVKVGVALALKRSFKKSRKASTSNWSLRRLSDSQLLYAANDAYAAVRCYFALSSD
jgi:hypothetical protein